MSSSRTEAANRRGSDLSTSRCRRWASRWPRARSSPGGSRSAIGSRPTQTICEISTDKIDTEVPAPASGVVAEILVGSRRRSTSGRCWRGSAVAGAVRRAGRGAPASRAGAPGRRPRRRRPAAPRPRPPRSRRPRGRRPPAAAAGGRRPRPPAYSPVVQRIAAEHGIDLDAVCRDRPRRPGAQAGRAGAGARRLDGSGNGDASADAADRRCTSRAPTGRTRRPPAARQASGGAARACRGCGARSAST